MSTILMNILKIKPAKSVTIKFGSMCTYVIKIILFQVKFIYQDGSMMLTNILLFNFKTILFENEFRLLLFVSCSLSLLDQNVRHFISLPFSSSMSSEPLFTKLKSSFIFWYSQQFHASLFKRSKSADFANNIPNKFIMFG